MSAHCSGSQADVSPGTERKTVAIVGPPNAGKSTLFNLLTGMRQKVANFPGVTVEHHTGLARLSNGREIDVIDLPGVYSLEPRSEDERVTRDALFGQIEGIPKPDAVLLILDSTNLGRHLMLAASVLSLGVPVLVALNMADDLRSRGGAVDVQQLSAQLGAPAILIAASKGEGIEEIRRFLAGQFPTPTPVQLPVLQDVPRCREWSARIGSKSGYQAPAPPVWTRRLDSVFLHPIGGPLVFLAVVIAVFQAMFTGAKPLMDATDAMVNGSGAWIASHLPESWWRDLIIEGIWGGVGKVIIFLPQILLLFAFIGVLEDSGYLARAALIADRTMARAGLQGKSFIPLLSAYACAVPAIMATRTIENKRDRIATILIAPFMTCSARLPVYTLIIAAFIPAQPFYAQTLALLGLYIIGFAAAVITARLLKSSILKSDHTPFLLEMPPYRWPTMRSIGLRLYDRAQAFLYRAGTVILAVAIVLWVLLHVPLKDGKAPPIEQSVAGTLGRAAEPAIQPLGFNWKIGIGLISSIAAREVIVGALATIYGIEGGSVDETAESKSLQTALQKDLSPAGAVALLIFFAFAMQCMSTLAVVRRETGSWRWPVVQFAYMSVLAYVGGLVAYRIALVVWPA
ncbi:MAG: ferrous iron transporter B [Acidobacteria bacterium]|nr:ferrous iron transporter B [Acidobacteriota bacterium]